MSAPIPIPRERLQKVMYRAVDLIEAFFPHPEIPTQITTLGQAQKDFIDCIQFGFPTSQLNHQKA